MKKNLGKIYRTMVIILGVLACLGSTYLAYYQSNNIFSLKDKNIQSATFIKYIFIYWIIIFIVFLLLYALGFIIEFLQSIDSKLFLLIKRSYNEIELATDDEKIVKTEDLWKRPKL
jgi:hypothetical protein